jgi:hypothetical protein
MTDHSYDIADRERRAITLAQQCPVHDEEAKPSGIRQ